MTFADIRSAVYAVLIALLLMPGSAFAQEVRNPPRVIRVVMDNDYAPFIFQTEDGELQGILIDQWRAWEKETGVRANIQVLDWAEAVQGLRAGRFDVIDSIVQTPERNDLEFTEPYAAVGGAIFHRNEISGITSLKSLRGFPVGVKAGDQHIERLREHGVTTVITFRNFQSIVNAAKRRQINVFVADEPAASYLLHKAGIEGEFRHFPVFRDQLRRAVRKGDTETLRLVADGFASVDPAVMRKIEDKWLGHPTNPYARYFRYAGYSTAAALVLIFVLAIWNRALGRRILERTAALTESEQRFRQIAENLREVFWLVAADSGKFLYVSPAYETVWGRSCSSVYADSKSFSEAIHADDRDAVVSAMADREHGVDVEFRVMQPNGTIRWVWVRGFPIRDESGRIYRFAGIADDITERKHAIDAVKQAEDHFRQVIDTIPGMVWCVEPDGRVTFLNQRWLDYTGLSVEEAVKDPTATIHPDDLPRVLASWHWHMLAGTPFEEEMRLRRADGAYLWFLVRTAPLHDEHGNVINWFGTSTDIADRRRAEQRVVESERRLVEAQRIAHVGSWVWNLRTETGIWSDECYRIFGAAEDEINIRDKAFALMQPEQRLKVAEAWTDAIQNKQPYEMEYRITKPHDGERILHTLAFIECDESGTPYRVHGTTQDVTELRRAEDTLKATTEQLRALSAKVQSAREEEGIRIAREIHDELGATLTSLRWELEAVRKTSSDPAKPLPHAALQQKLTAMLDTTDTMITIVRRIAADLRPAILDMIGLEEALEWQARQFENRTGIPVHYESADVDIELTLAESTAVFRIFQEALTNVLRHAQATRVDVSVLEDTGVLVLLVADNGRGITESERTGQDSLGLLGMRERAHLIGGQLDVTGVEGEGTTVTLRLPLPSPTNAMTPPPRAQHSEKGSNLPS